MDKREIAYRYTYGLGIDPEQIPELLAALDHYLSQSYNGVPLTGTHAVERLAAAAKGVRVKPQKPAVLIYTR